MQAEHRCGSVTRRSAFWWPCSGSGTLAYTGTCWRCQLLPRMHKQACAVDATWQCCPAVVTDILLCQGRLYHIPARACTRCGDGGEQGLASRQVPRSQGARPGGLPAWQVHACHVHTLGRERRRCRGRSPQASNASQSSGPASSRRMCSGRWQAWLAANPGRAGPHAALTRKLPRRRLSRRVSAPCACALALTLTCAEYWASAQSVAQERTSYKAAFVRLRSLKGEIEHLQLLVENAAAVMKRDFDAWRVSALMLVPI